MKKTMLSVIVLAAAMVLFGGTASAQFIDYPLRSCTTYFDCGDWEDPCRGFVDCEAGTCVRTVDNNPCSNQGTNNECRAIPGDPPDDYDCYQTCNDNNDCEYGTCVDGECIGGECSSDEECDDANVCNGVEECTADAECTNPDDLVCDNFCDPIDGCIDCLQDSDCSYGTCSPEGVCVGGECTSDGDCDDGDECNGLETCTNEGVCIDGEDLVCDDFCNPLIGCVECLTGDDCPFGTCSGTGDCLPGGCSGNGDCDDENICTGVETCTNEGRCTEPDDLECDDFCDPVEGCVECLANDDCPFGTCVEGACAAGDCSSDADCDDDDICTGVETCTNEGVCTDPVNLECLELCDPLLGCVECLINADCPFGTCSGPGECLDGGCIGDADCNDQNICTGVETCTAEGECTEPDDLECPEACDSNLGCVECLTNADCDFGTCIEGACAAGDCSSNADCDDDDVCNGVEICTNDGICTDPDDLACDGFCDPERGCVECLDDEGCDFGICTPTGVCLEGGCTGDEDCDDNDVCSGVETCMSDGVCTDPEPLECPFVCDPEIGCVECIENEDCSAEGDICDEGECLPVPQTICDLKVRPKYLKTMKIFKQGQVLIKVTAVKGGEADFDPYGEISIGSFEAQKAYVKMNKKKGALLKIKVTVPSGTLINEVPRGPLDVIVGDCSGSILVK